MHVTAEYLREQAHHCVALALEALGVELMEKAAEVEQAIAIPRPRLADER
jgi:hypothetical protein